MPTKFPFAQTKSMLEWSNYSGTLGIRSIPIFCTPDAVNAVASTGGALRPQGDSIRAILDYCFTRPTPEPIRAMGARLSFSRIIEPGRVALDPPYMNTIWRVSADSLTDDYKKVRGELGCAPFFVEGGTTIAAINQRIGEIGFALQTSGAGNSHRIAGCIATGTHGSALRVGAVHDTVLGIHVVIGPNQALFVQPESAPACNDDFAGWLEKQTGIPTKNVKDDASFQTFLVSLGSLGIVFSVIMEAVPLYRLERKTFACARNDARLWEAMRTLDTAPLHPLRRDPPHHFEVVFNPYGLAGSNGAYVTLLWKAPVAGTAFTSPAPVPPDTSSDTMGLIGALAEKLDSFVTAPITTFVLQEIISGQLSDRFAGSDGTVKFPGEQFGPTSLPPGKGASTEIVVNHTDTERALRTIFAVLDAEAEAGRHLLGAMAVRFVPQSQALLAMNISEMNCYIELPSIRNHDVLALYVSVWDALEKKEIPFTCHWGQLHGLTPVRINGYFGDRAKTWKAKREQLLDATARTVFASPLLDEVGLG